MFNYLVEQQNLDMDFVISQVKNGTVSNCIDSELLNSVINLPSQTTYVCVDDLKKEIDQTFIDNVGNIGRNLKDIKHIHHLLECISNKKFNDLVILNDIIDSETKVVNNLYDIVDSRRIHNRFCDLFDLDGLRDAVEHRNRRLWGTLFQEGTNTILFSDNGVGKTQLCMMLANGLARGEKTIFDLEVEDSPSPRLVLYYDFEMSNQMLLKRCGFKELSDLENLTQEDITDRLPQFIRVDLHSMRSDLLKFGVDKDVLNESSKIRQLFTHIEWYLKNHEEYNIVTVVDNITSIYSRTEDNRSAQILMNDFNDLKQEYGSRITNLILAHTPKVNPEQQLRKEHLKGAKSLSDLADAVIGLKDSYQDKDLFYLKQVKCRLDGVEFGEDNVLIFKRTEDDNGAFSLVVKGTDREVAHIKTEEARKLEIEAANEDLYESITDAFNVSFNSLDEFPSHVAMDERSDYIFNASDISNIISEDSDAYFPERQITRALNANGLKYKGHRIKGGQSKKGYLLERLT
ncbi:AAA family ATPase [uncultured Draconibacterium sp.]|uniref:AAA family ATPase n=1 Tax=uncultured Draconibacterium sp. TaxID=1573823 RepID=UPI0032613289